MSAEHSCVFIYLLIYLFTYLFIYLLIYLFIYFYLLQNVQTGSEAHPASYSTGIGVPFRG
jgi:hypothetical protein